MSTNFTNCKDYKEIVKKLTRELLDSSTAEVFGENIKYENIGSSCYGILIENENFFLLITLMVYFIEKDTTVYKFIQYCYDSNTVVCSYDKRKEKKSYNITRLEEELIDLFWNYDRELEGFFPEDTFIDSDFNRRDIFLNILESSLRIFEEKPIENQGLDLLLDESNTYINLPTKDKTLYRCKKNKCSIM
jgi:hypothetical protein